MILISFGLHGFKARYLSLTWFIVKYILVSQYIGSYEVHVSENLTEPGQAVRLIRSTALLDPC